MERYFLEGEVRKLSHNLYSSSKGWLYSKRKTGPSFLFGEGIDEHILRTEDYDFILLRTYRPEVVAQWIKMEKKIPGGDPITTRRPEIYYYGGRIIRVTSRLVKRGRGYKIWLFTMCECGELFWKLRIGDTWIDLTEKPTPEILSYYALREEIIKEEA